MSFAEDHVEKFMLFHFLCQESNPSGLYGGSNGEGGRVRYEGVREESKREKLRRRTEEIGYFFVHISKREMRGQGEMLKKGEG